MNTLGCTQKLAVDQCSGLDFAMEPVCMFDKIHLPLNFKSKVSRDDLRNKNECRLTSAFYYLDFWLHNILKKNDILNNQNKILIINRNKKKLSIEIKISYQFCKFLQMLKMVVQSIAST
jgi:hypothetical protein